MSAALHTELAEVGVERFTAGDYRVGGVCHIVLFRFRPDVTPQEREDVADGFRALAGSQRAGRTYIESIEAGPQVSGEDGVNSYDYGFVVRFRSQGDRNFYVGRPIVTEPAFFDHDHEAFKERVGPLLDPSGGAQVLDFLDRAVPSRPMGTTPSG